MSATMTYQEIDALAEQAKHAHEMAQDYRKDQTPATQARNRAVLILQSQHKVKVAVLCRAIERGPSTWYNEIRAHAPSDYATSLPRMTKEAAQAALEGAVKEIKRLAAKEATWAAKRTAAVQALGQAGLSQSQIVDMTGLTYIVVKADLEAEPAHQADTEWGTFADLAKRVSATPAMVIDRYDKAKAAGGDKADKLPPTKAARSRHPLVDLAAGEAWWEENRLGWKNAGELVAHLEQHTGETVTYQQVYAWLRRLKDMGTPVRGEEVDGRMVYDPADALRMWRKTRRGATVLAAGADPRSGRLGLRALADIVGVDMEAAESRVRSWRRHGGLPLNEEITRGGNRLRVYEPAAFLQRWYGDQVWNAAVALAGTMPVQQVAATLSITEAAAEHAAKAAGRGGAL